jgi:hypothetical protein
MICRIKEAIAQASILVMLYINIEKSFSVSGQENDQCQVSCGEGTTPSGYT